MKKEKKAVIKNSQYYYKKASRQSSITRILIPGIFIISGMTIGLGFGTKENRQITNELQKESGYNQYIEDQKNALEEKYENGEISDRVYSAYLADINDITFEGYLKDTENSYYLAEYNKNQEDLKNKGTIALCATMGTLIVLGASELTRAMLLQKKARKLEQSETVITSHGLNSYLDAYENNINLSTF